MDKDNMADSLQPQIKGPQQTSRMKEYGILGILLIAAVIHAVIYIHLMPPWQHYDEPNHFEYAWLLSNNRSVPQKGEYSPELSRLVVESMIANKFYEGWSSSPDLSEGAEVRIGGFPQFDEPPLYYLTVAFPLTLLSSQSVEIQLTSGRYVSMLYYLVTIVAAWGFARALTSSDSPLRWLVPASVLMLPGFTDLMTAVNNDALAVAVVSLFLWVSARMVKSGFSLVGLLLLVLLAVVAYFSKATALIVVPLLVLVVLLSLARGKLRWLIWVGLGVGLLVLLVAVITWGDAAFWARSTFQSEHTRLLDDRSPVGEHAFQMVLDPRADSPQKIWIRQVLTEEQGSRLDHKTVTLGAWMWASQPVEFNTPVIRTYPGDQVAFENINLTEEPAFFAFAVDLDRDPTRTFVSIEPIEPVDVPLTVYVDGIILVEGEYPESDPPVFDSSAAASGVWAGVTFINLLQNPSAEQSWPRLRSWVDRLGVRVLPDPGVNTPSVILNTILDYQVGGQYYWSALQRLGRTFWAQFAWGQLSLLGQKPYRPVAALTALGILGSLVYVVRQKMRIDWRVAVFILTFVLLGWMAAFLRGANYVLIPYKIYLPVARYVYPVIVPTMFLLSLGWFTLLSYPHRWLKLKSSLLYIIQLLPLLVLDMYAIYSIARFYG